jgi:hypothetical protein
MKIITNILGTILFVCLSTFISFSKDDACFKLYVCDFETVKDSAKINEFINLNAQRATEDHIIKNEFIYLNEPLITDVDIIKYKPNSNDITFSDEAWVRIHSKIKKFHEDFKSFGKTGVPFIITINNKFILDGLFWSMFSSFLPPHKPLIRINWKEKDKILEFPQYEFFSKSDSLIKQERLFIDCLKAQGKVVE